MLTMVKSIARSTIVAIVKLAIGVHLKLANDLGTTLWAWWFIPRIVSGLVHPIVISGRLAPTYPIQKTRVITHKNDSWDEPKWGFPHDLPGPRRSSLTQRHGVVATTCRQVAHVLCDALLSMAEVGGKGKIILQGYPLVPWENLLIFWARKIYDDVKMGFF